MPFIVWMLSRYGMHIEERKNGMCVIFCRKWVKVGFAAEYDILYSAECVVYTAFMQKESRHQFMLSVFSLFILQCCIL